MNLLKKKIVFLKYEFLNLFLFLNMVFLKEIILKLDFLNHNFLKISLSFIAYNTKVCKKKSKFVVVCLDICTRKIILICTFKKTSKSLHHVICVTISTDMCFI